MHMCLHRLTFKDGDLIKCKDCGATLGDLSAKFSDGIVDPHIEMRVKKEKR